MPQGASRARIRHLCRFALLFSTLSPCTIDQSLGQRPQFRRHDSLTGKSSSRMEESWMAEIRQAALVNGRMVAASDEPAKRILRRRPFDVRSLLPWLFPLAIVLFWQFAST